MLETCLDRLLGSLQALPSQCLSLWWQSPRRMYPDKLQNHELSQKNIIKCICLHSLQNNFQKPIRSVAPDRSVLPGCQMWSTEVHFRLSVGIQSELTCGALTNLLYKICVSWPPTPSLTKPYKWKPVSVCDFEHSIRLDSINPRHTRAAIPCDATILLECLIALCSRSTIWRPLTLQVETYFHSHYPRLQLQTKH